MNAILNIINLCILAKRGMHRDLPWDWSAGGSSTTSTVWVSSSWTSSEPSSPNDCMMQHDYSAWVNDMICIGVLCFGYTTPDHNNTAGSKHPITARFWTGRTISVVMRVSYHYRFLQTDSVLQLHCRFFTKTGRIQVHQHCRFMRPPSNVTANITIGLWFNRQCYHKNHCRLW